MMLREMGKNICYFEPRKMVAQKKYLLFSELCIFFEQKKAYRYFLSYIIREDTKVWKNHLELFMRENTVQEKPVSHILHSAVARNKPYYKMFLGKFPSFLKFYSILLAKGGLMPSLEYW